MTSRERSSVSSGHYRNRFFRDDQNRSVVVNRNNLHLNNKDWAVLTRCVPRLDVQTDQRNKSGEKGGKLEMEGGSGCDRQTSAQW